MPDFGLLYDLLILLGMALASALLFNQLRLSPIVGYLVSGMLAGPYGLHLVTGVHEVELIAEVGVILLLFTIGLEFSVTRLLRLKKLILIGGSVQILLTGGLVYAGARLFGTAPAPAAVLAMAISLSSTAIVLKLLLEKGEIDAAHGRISLAILLAQDLCVVFFLVALPLLRGQTSGLSALGLLKAAALLMGLFLFSRYLLQPLLRSILRTKAQELFRITILALILGTAWITGQAGLSLALGAFLAGLSLSESPYAHQALSDVLPFRDTFLAIFFISIGMLIDLGLVVDQWPLVLGLTLAVALLKTLTGMAATLMVAYPLRIALLAGILLFQVGEFSFVLLKEALALEILPEPIYQSTLAVIALTMIATPFMAGRAPALAARLAALMGRRPLEIGPEIQERTANLDSHVIIAGYGLSGRNVGKILRQMTIPYIFVELNGESVERGRQSGEFIVYGDATSPEVLTELGIARARAVVLAINDPSALARAISSARSLNREVYILARTRYVAELDYLTGLGADEVVPDEFEASLQLSAFLLRRFNLADGKIIQVLSALRQEHYGKMLRRGSPSSGGGGALSVLEGGTTEFQAVPDDSPCLGQSLADLAFRTHTGTMVVGVIRHDRTIYSPPPDLLLEKGDTLMLMGSPEDIIKARELLHGHPA